MTNKLGITPKLTLIFILFAGAVLVGLGLPAYNSGRTSLEAATYSELLTTTIEKQAALASWVADRQDSIGDIANQAQLRETVTALIAAEPGSSDAGRVHGDLLTDLENWVGEGHGFLSMEVIDAATGGVIAATDAIEEGKFREEQLYFINGLQAAYVQNPYYDLALQRPSMTAAAPVLSPDGRVAAVLAGTLNMDEMNAIIQRRSGLHQTVDAFLINTSNFFVTQPRLNPDPAALQLGLHTQDVNRCLAHNSGVIAAPDYRDVPAFIVYRWLSDRQLCLIEKIDQNEALAPSRALASTMGLTGGLVLLIGSIVAFGMSRTITRPVRQLVQGAGQIGHGDLDYRIEVKSGDEIGKLGIAFNAMAVAIGEKETQLRKWATDLEQRVEVRTSELRASEERYRILSETSPDMIFVIDRQDKVQYVNNLAARQFGKNPEQVIGKARTELFPPGIAEDQARGLQQVIKSAEPLSAESSITFPGGQFCLETQLVPLRNEKGEVSAVMGVSRDITERKRAEEQIRQLNTELEASVEKRTAQLRDTVELNQKIIEASSLGIFACRADGPCIIANSAVARISGASVEKMLQLNFRELESWKKNGLFDKVEAALSTGKEHRAEIHLTTAFGKDAWINYYITTFTSNGQPHFLMLVDDITERKQAEEELMKYREHLEELVKDRTEDLRKAMEDLMHSNAELERFAYVASHDLQEPLRMVTSYLQLLERRYKDKLDSDALEFINYAVDGSNRMKTLINDLLAYSRVGTRGKEFALTDCEEVLERVLSNLEVSIEESQGKVTHDPLPSVIADDVQLESLFQNLIGNAIKFHGKNPPRIHVGVKKDEKNWVFSVSDNGIGIDPQYFERIFIIFQRLHNHEEYPGTGIGLAISKRIVERHGGRVWIESQPGKGSTFYFTLPMKGTS
jgi:PAS domain S-box-containing protein